MNQWELARRPGLKHFTLWHTQETNAMNFYVKKSFSY